MLPARTGVKSALTVGEAHINVKPDETGTQQSETNI